jgi:hypothetical protein
MFLKRVKVEKELLLDGNEYTRHRLNLSFVKVGMLPKSENSVNPILPVSHMLQQEGMSNGMQACHFHERMSHVASTGGQHTMRGYTYSKALREGTGQFAAK